MSGQRILEIAHLHIQQSNIPIALELLTSAVGAKLQQNPNTLEVAELMKELAFLCEDQGKLQQALQFYESALAIQRDHLDESDINVAKTKNNIACVQYDLKIFGDVSAFA